MIIFNLIIIQSAMVFVPWIIFLFLGVYVCSEDKLQICVPESRKHPCDELMKTSPSEVACDNRKNEYECLREVANKNFHFTAVRTDVAYAASQKELKLADKLIFYAAVNQYETPSNFKIAFNAMDEEKSSICYQADLKHEDSHYQLPFKYFESVLASNCTAEEENITLSEKAVECLKQTLGKSCIKNYWEINLDENFQNGDLSEHCNDPTECDVTINLVENDINPDKIGQKKPEFQSCLENMKSNSSCQWRYNKAIVLGIDDPRSEEYFSRLIEKNASNKKKKKRAAYVEDVLAVIYGDGGNKFEQLSGDWTLEKYASETFLSYKSPKALNRTVRLCTKSEEEYNECLFNSHLMFYNGIQLGMECFQESNCLESVENNSTDFTIFDVLDIENLSEQLEIFAYDITSKYKLVAVVNNTDEYIKIEDLPKRKSCMNDESYFTIDGALECFEEYPGAYANIDYEREDFLKPTDLKVVCSNGSIPVKEFNSHEHCYFSKLTKSIYVLRKDYPQFAKEDLKFMLRCFEKLKFNNNNIQLEFDSEDNEYRKEILKFKNYFNSHDSYNSPSQRIMNNILYIICACVIKMWNY